VISKPLRELGRRKITKCGTRFERFLRAPLSILGLRRLLQLGVKNQKLFEVRAKAMSSSFDLARLQQASPKWSQA
jgi:hypothetical protein